jgi:hypothetical protein
MGDIREHRPVLFLMAAFSRHAEALEWARRTSEQEWGRIALASPLFEFKETSYYSAQMGRDLKKIFWAFERLVDADQLPGRKHRSNLWEQQFARQSKAREARPLNLDPGYLTEAKLVLASTKDRDHRIYLAEGIFAEVTLHFRQRAWRAHPWTYPDYQRSDYHQFLTQCRTYLRDRYRVQADFPGW